MAPPNGPFVPGPRTGGGARRGLWLGVLGGLVAVATLAGLAVAYGFGGGHAPDPTPSASTIAAPPRTTCGPPSVVDPKAECSSTAECYDARPAPVACSGTHTWEVFAYGDLPTGSHVTDKRDPAVSSVCSVGTLIAVNIAAVTWRTDVLLPTAAEQAAGPTTFRCLAGQGKDALTGDQLHK